LITFRHSAKKWELGPAKNPGKPVDSEGSSYLPTVYQGFDIPPWAPKTTKTQNLDFGSFPQKNIKIPRV